MSLCRLIGTTASDIRMIRGFLPRPLPALLGF